MKKGEALGMTLSDGLIYFGVVCLILGIFIIFTDHRLCKKTLGNKKLAERIDFFKNNFHFFISSSPSQKSIFIIVI